MNGLEDFVQLLDDDSEKPPPQKKPPVWRTLAQQSWKSFKPYLGNTTLVKTETRNGTGNTLVAPKKESLEVIEIEDEENLSQRIQSDNNNVIVINDSELTPIKTVSETQIGRIHKDNRLLGEFIEKCLDLEYTEGMYRVIHKNLIRCYEGACETFKKSAEFERLVTKAITRLQREPHLKFSHVKNLCESLKLNGPKKRVQLTTLATNLKENGSERNLKRNGLTSSSRPSKRQKTDVIIDLDDDQKDTSIINLDDYLNDVIELDESIKLDDEKENHDVEENGEDSLVVPHIEVTWKPDLDTSVPTTSNSEVVTETNEEPISNNNEPDPQGLDKEKEQKIEGIEREIAFCRQTITKLDEEEVEDDSMSSPYVRSEQLKEKIVLLYKQLCALTGCSPVKRRTVRLEVLEGHPPGPARLLEMLINNNIGSDGIPPFPNFRDVVKCVVEANQVDNIGWNKAQIMNEAHALFTQCGRALQRKRQQREWRHLMSCVNSELVAADPADEDPVLLAKLEEHKRIAVRTENDLLERYAQMHPTRPGPRSENLQSEGSRIIQGSANQDNDQSDGDTDFESPRIQIASNSNETDNNNTNNVNSNLKYPRIMISEGQIVENFQTCQSKSQKQPNLHIESNLQCQIQQNLHNESNLRRPMQSDLHIESNSQCQMQPNLQVASNLQFQLQPNLQVASNLQRQIQPNLQSQLQPNLQVASNLQCQMQPNLQVASNLQFQLQPNLHVASHLQSQIQPNLQVTSNLQCQMQPNLQVASNLQFQLQPNSQVASNLHSQIQPNLQVLSNLQCQMQPNLQVASNLQFQLQPNLQVASNLQSQIQPNLQVASNLQRPMQTNLQIASTSRLLVPPNLDHGGSISEVYQHSTRSDSNFSNYCPEGPSVVQSYVKCTRQKSVERILRNYVAKRYPNESTKLKKLKTTNSCSQSIHSNVPANSNSQIADSTLQNTDANLQMAHSDTDTTDSSSNYTNSDDSTELPDGTDMNLQSAHQTHSAGTEVEIKEEPIEAEPITSLLDVDMNTKGLDDTANTNNNHESSELETYSKDSEGKNKGNHITALLDVNSDVQSAALDQTVDTNTNAGTLETDTDAEVTIKKEPIDFAALLEELGDNYTFEILDIIDPFLVIEISSDSSDGEDL